jgi:hypothetical protein
MQLTESQSEIKVSNWLIAAKVREKYAVSRATKGEKYAID